MRTDRIIDSLGYIDEDMICEAAEWRRKGRKKKAVTVKRWTAAAACLCLLAVGIAVSAFLTDSYNQGITVGEEGVTIPKLEVSLSAHGEDSAKMIGFFIYEGRCYVYYRDIYEDVDLIDERLGTVTGLIDEWTPKDGYVDYAGSVRGDFYSLKGYAPSFMLAMKDQRGVLSVFICNNGITMKYGSELYEDKLRLSENYSRVLYESRDSWYSSMGNVFRLEKAEEEVSDFIRCLNEAEFMASEKVPFYDVYEELYHLYFVMKDGTVAELRLYDEGYVRFQGILDLCLKLPEEEYKGFVNLLDSDAGVADDSLFEKNSLQK